MAAAAAGLFPTARHTSKRWLIGVCLLLLPLLLTWALHSMSQYFGAQTPQDVVQIKHAQRIGVAANGASKPQDLLEHWPSAHMQMLPYGHTRSPDEQAQAQWFKLDFRITTDAVQPYLLSFDYRPSVQVFLDNALLTGSGPEVTQELAARRFVLGRHYMLANVPPALLKAGDHQLIVRLGTGSYEGATLSSILLGPADKVMQAQRAREWRQGLRSGTALTGALLGLFLLILWLALRQEWIYGLGGLHCLLIAFLLSPYLSNTPVLPPPWWRLLLDVADVLAKGLLLLLTLRLLNFQQRWMNITCLAYIVLAIPIDAYAAWQGFAWVDFKQPWPWWALGSRALVLGAALGLASYAAVQRVSWSLALSALAIATATCLWAYVSLFALIWPRPFVVIDLNVFGYLALLLLTGLLLQRRFIGSLQAQRQAKQELQDQLAQRSAQLQANYEALRLSEQARSAAIERERLMQEMHDGLGSQLLTTKLSVQRGQITPDAVVTALEDCLNEMRLNVDTLSVSDGDLSLLLANLRHRLGPRLQSAGLDLHWQVGDTPLVPSLCGSNGRELIRIAQEALNNILHHAQARTVSFETRFEQGVVQLLIGDDGCGMPPQASEGRGLRNIRARAKRIGAQVRWSANHPGTCLCLSWTLVAHDA